MFKTVLQIMKNGQSGVSVYLEAQKSASRLQV